MKKILFLILLATSSICVANSGNINDNINLVSNLLKTNYFGSSNIAPLQTYWCKKRCWRGRDGYVRCKRRCW